MHLTDTQPELLKSLQPSNHSTKELSTLITQIKAGSEINLWRKNPGWTKSWCRHMTCTLYISTTVPAKLYVVILKTERSNFIDQETRRLRTKNVTKQKQRPVSDKSCASSKGLVPSAGEVPRPLILTRRLTVKAA